MPVGTYDHPTGENASNWKGGPVSVVCERCGMRFLMQRGGTPRRYCSHSCANRRAHGLKENPIGAVTGHQRASRLYERPDACQRCGEPARETRSNAVIHIHHKDRNPLNNEPTNIEFLCPPCHRLEHGQQKFEQGGEQ